MQAIVAGTSRAAELLGLADRIGTVKPGYVADLLVVRGDPVSSITATRSVALVIKSGRIVFAEDPALYRPGMSDTRERRVPRFMDRGHGAGDPAGVP